MKTIKIRRKLKSTLLKIKELEQYKGKTIELLIKVKEIQKPSPKKIKSMAGVLYKYAKPELIKSEKKAWDLAVKEKHENYRR